MPETVVTVTSPVEIGRLVVDLLNPTRYAASAHTISYEDLNGHLIAKRTHQGVTTLLATYLWWPALLDLATNPASYGWDKWTIDLDHVDNGNAVTLTFTPNFDPGPDPNANVEPPVITKSNMYEDETPSTFSEPTPPKAKAVHPEEASEKAQIPAED